MNIASVKDLGALVRDRRQKLGMTQQNLADKVGVSRIWLVALERGKPSAQIDLVLRTVRELGLSIRIEPESPAARSHGIDLGAILQSGKKSGSTR